MENFNVVYPHISSFYKHVIKKLEYYMNAKSQKMLIGLWNKMKMNVKINNMIDPLYNKNDDDYDNIYWNMYWNIFNDGNVNKII